jgi:L-alanine-DL-glutamate epimerase-like enolase superfamily enzyme
MWRVISQKDGTVKADESVTRRAFLDRCGQAAVLAVTGWMLQPNALGAPFPTLDVPEKVFLKSWELLEELPSFFLKPGRDGNKKVLRITASNGAVGVVPARFCQGFSSITEGIVKQTNLLDHEKLYDLMVERNVPVNELKAADILCWDLHARMLTKPLHGLLGTTRNNVLRYGDVRGQQPDFSPKKYADNVARYLKANNLKATKLHFPGAMGTKESIRFDMVKETLRLIREATGPDPILAWDPYPGSAESATPSIEEAKEILNLMAELKYVWIEGPLPPSPEETQMPKYVELMKTAKIRVQPEGPGPIGDGTDVKTIRRWAEAGAANQFSTDVYIRDGITPAVRLLEWARNRPAKDITINLHWSWLPHLHLAMACDESVFPILEFPMSGEVPPRYFDKQECALAPDWPGIYLME